MKLPHQAITTVHRSDAWGTTFNFTNYLSKVSPDWKSKVGDGTSVNWPNGVGGKGNPGVASYVQQVDGAIGYVKYAYVIENKLIYTDMVNKAEKRVKPTMAAFQAAAGNADFTKVKDFYLILTDQPGEKSWPSTAATSMLLRKDSPADQNQLALKFLALKKGQPQAKALDYVRCPTTSSSRSKRTGRRSSTGRPRRSNYSLGGEHKGSLQALTWGPESNSGPHFVLATA